LNRHSDSTSFESAAPIPVLHSFPTRRSSDLTNCLPASGPAFISSHAVFVHCSTRPTNRPTMIPITAKPTARLTLASFDLAISRRSEEHTSELQSLRHLVCRLLLEKKNSNRAR